MIVTKVILHTVPRDCLLRDIIGVLLCRLSYLYRQTFLQTRELFARHGLNLGVGAVRIETDFQLQIQLQNQKSVTPITCSCNAAAPDAQRATRP